MTNTQDREILWVRFPDGEAKVSMMSWDGRPGLLIQHKEDARGEAVKARAKEIGFKTARMQSGRVCSFMIRPENGYPFRTRELARALGGVALPVKESVIRAEAFPRPATAPAAARRPVARPAKPEVQNSPAPVEAARATSEPAPAAEPEPQRVLADPQVGDEIAALLSGADLRPDEPAETADTFELA